MKKELDYSKYTFYMTLAVLVIVLVMAYPYLSSVAQFSMPEPSINPPELQEAAPEMHMLTICQDGTCEYTTIQSALDNAEDWSYVSIMDDKTYDESISITKKITLDCGGATLWPSSAQTAVVKILSTHVTVQNCNINGRTAGVWGLVNEVYPNIHDFTAIKGNTISALYPIVIRGHGTGSAMYGGLIEGNDMPCLLIGSMGISTTGAELVETTISDNAVCGMSLGSSHDNYIIGNALEHYSYTKNVLIFENAQDNIIIGNAFTKGNVTFGYSHDTYDPGNVFYHNNFGYATFFTFYNTSPEAGSEIIFDNGYPDGGNWWIYCDPKIDDYSGPNQDIPGSDGIVDNSYNPARAAVDNYPLATTYSGAVNYPPLSRFVYTVGFDRVAHFYDQSTDDVGIASREWDFGDGTTSSAKNPTHQYVLGEYTAKLTVYDAEDYVSTYEVPVSIINMQPVALFSVNATRISEGRAVLFDATNSYDEDGTIASYSWDFDDYSIGPPPGGPTAYAIEPSEAIQVHTYANPGTYNPTLTVTDNDGDSDEYTMSIRVSATAIQEEWDITDEEYQIIIRENSPPVADAGEDQTIYAGDTVTFDGTGTDSDGTIVLYEWDFNSDGTIDWSSDERGMTTYAYNTKGTYTATLTVTDNWLQTGSDDMIVAVLKKKAEEGITSGGGGGGISKTTLPSTSGLAKNITEVPPAEGGANESMTEETGKEVEQMGRGSYAAIMASAIVLFLVLAGITYRLRKPARKRKK